MAEKCEPRKLHTLKIMGEKRKGQSITRIYLDDRELTGVTEFQLTQHGRRQAELTLRLWVEIGPDGLSPGQHPPLSQPSTPEEFLFMDEESPKGTLIKAFNRAQG
jgi:hypothetical protein